MDSVQEDAHPAGPAPRPVNNSAGRPRQEAGRPGCRLDSRLVQRRATRVQVGGVHLLCGFGVMPMSLETPVLVLELGKLRPTGLPDAGPGLAPCPRRAARSVAGAKCLVEAL